MPKYTIAICNLNMSDTIRDSVESILALTDDRFEILVVDDGSTDESPNVLRTLEAEYRNVRCVYLPSDPNRHLGRTRNISVREADGEYVLLQLDADDKYRCCIQEFVELYHQLENHRSSDFYLKGNNINMAPRKFLEQFGPYRNLPVGAEDIDLWRRLLADDAVVWLDHDNIKEEIRDQKSPSERFRRSFRVKTGDFQAGISYRSYLAFYLRNRAIWRFPLYFLLCTVALLIAARRDKYQAPPGFRRKGVLFDEISKIEKSLPELEAEYGFTADWDNMTKDARTVFADQHLDG